MPLKNSCCPNGMLCAWGVGEEKKRRPRRRVSSKAGPSPLQPVAGKQSKAKQSSRRALSKGCKANGRPLWHGGGARGCFAAALLTHLYGGKAATPSLQGGGESLLLPPHPPPIAQGRSSEREAAAARGGQMRRRDGRQAGRQGEKGSSPKERGVRGGGFQARRRRLPLPLPLPLRGVRMREGGGGGGGGLFAGAVGARPGGDTAEAGTRAGGFAPNCLLAGRKGRGEGRRRGAAGSCSSLPTCLCRRPCRLLGAATFPACLPARSVTKKAHGVTWGGQSLSRAQP